MDKLPTTSIEQKFTVEKIPQPKRVFVEIGGGEHPILYFNEDRWAKEDYYIGIDIDKADLYQGKNSSDRFHERKIPKEHILFIRGDMNRLSLKEKTIGELYVANVFGLWGEKMGGFLSEASRVLRSDGRLIIFEQYTPMPLDDYMDRFKRQHNGLRTILEQGGFVLDAVVTPKDAKWNELMDQYNYRENISGTRDYILIASLRDK